MSLNHMETCPHLEVKTIAKNAPGVPFKCWRCGLVMFSRGDDQITNALSRIVMEGSWGSE